MDKFSIEEGAGERNRWGGEIARITIGSFSEKIDFDTSYWSIEQYHNQWKQAVSDIVTGKKERTCLFTTMHPLDADKCVASWVMYREGDVVYFQNHEFILRYLRGTFDFQNPEKMISERETTFDDGRKISEWSIHISALIKWLEEQT